MIYVQNYAIRLLCKRLKTFGVVFVIWDGFINKS